MIAVGKLGAYNAKAPGHKEASGRFGKRIIVIFAVRFILQ